MPPGRQILDAEAQMETNEGKIKANKMEIEQLIAKSKQGERHLESLFEESGRLRDKFALNTDQSNRKAKEINDDAHYKQCRDVSDILKTYGVDNNLTHVSQEFMKHLQESLKQIHPHPEFYSIDSKTIKRRQTIVSGFMKMSYKEDAI